MKHIGWCAGAALVGGLAVAALGAGPADGPGELAQESMTIRGETFLIWPLDDLRRRGFPIPEIPEDENVFFDYVQAIDAYKDVPSELEGAFGYALSTGWPEQQGEELRAFLLDEANQRAIGIVREASASESFHLYYFGDPRGSIIAVLLPNLRHHRDLGKLMVVDGLRLEEQGDYRGALANYAATMRMGHQLGEGITLIETLVGVAVWTMGDRAILQMALHRELSPEDLRLIHDTLDELADLCPTAAAGIENERRLGTLMIDELIARPFSINQTISALSGGPGSINPPPETGWGRLEARIGRLLLPDRTIKSQMNAFYDHYADRVALPAYEADWPNFSEDEAIAAIPQWNVFARILLPSLSRASILCERGRMQSLATRIVVALRLYAAEHGRPPARLAALAEFVPTADLIDPFSGKEFVYQPDGAGWRLYSISEDFTDDGGKVGEDRFVPDYVVQFPPPEPAAFVPTGETATN